MIEDKEWLESYQRRFDEACEKARRAGFELVHSTETTLLLDLDNGTSVDRYRSMLRSIGNLYGLKETGRWPSKSGVGLHVTLQCKPLPFVERVALQACLGSDPLREALAVSMYRDGINNPSVLFKPAKKAEAA